MNPYTLNPPESEVAFEKLCLAILKRHWSRSGLERYAKKGEEQFGVDIFDTLGETPMYGAQCKLKEQWKSLEPSEIRGEVRKAKKFPIKLDHYAILTTGKISGAAQLAIQALNQEHRATGLFTIELFTWEKLTELIRQYTEIEQQFYGGLHSDDVAKMSSKLEFIVERTETLAANAANTEIDALIDEARSNVTPANAQIAVALLNRILRSKGSELTDWHRFRISSNLGAANLMVGKGTEAARHFLDAKQYRPNDELAITNEVLAYHLLAQQDQTRAKATEALERFPNSTRVWSLWIQSQDSESPYEDLLNAIPTHVRNDAEVAVALCKRAMVAGDLTSAIRHAKDAVANKPAWAQAHLVLAQAHFATIAMADRAKVPLKGEEKKTNLARALASLDDAIAKAGESESYVKAEAFALKSDIAAIEGRKEDAARFAREAFGADPSELHGQLAMAQASVAMKNLDEAIRILEEAYPRSDCSAPVSFMLGQALSARGSESDLCRAIEVFGSAKLDGLGRELIDPIAVGMIRALVRSGRFQEVPAYLNRPEIVGSELMAATANAYVALKQSSDKASELLNHAIATRRERDTHIAAQFLANTLMEAGRLTEALPILQQLFISQMPNFDVGQLLGCASRLDEHKVILDTCQELWERGVQDWKVIDFECSYLEKYDFSKCINRLQEFIAANPTHRLAELRLAIVATRFGQEALVTVTEELLPPAEELPMSLAVPTVHLLQWHNHNKLAVDYAYRVLGSHYSELEAHKAYLASLMTGARPEDIPATMERVEIGSAVQYAEGEGPVGWFVIEDTQEPKTEFEEISATSSLASAMLGKRVGDSFILAKSPIADRVGRIVQILSKYTRRFQAIGEEMQIRFGEQSVIQRMRVPAPEKMTAADLKPMLDSVKAHSEAVAKLREAYKTIPVTLHILGTRLGQSAYEAIIELAVSEEDSIRCAPADKASFSNAVTTLRSKSTVVLDLDTIGTLQLLGILVQVLTAQAFRFVMSPATFTELQQVRAKSRFSSPHSTMHYAQGQHFVTEFTEDDAQNQKATFEEIVRVITQNVTVVAVPQTAALTRERREVLEQLVGLHGTESALLSLTPGYAYWTDDHVAGEVAKTEIGCERIWTQALIEYLASVGLLQRNVAAEAHAKLAGFGYDATHFSGGVMVSGLRISNGSTENFPMKQLIRAFSNVTSANLGVAFRMLAEFILKLTLEPFLPETKCMALKAMLDTFPNDTNVHAQLISFRSQCANLITLNPLAQADFLKCFDQWFSEKFAL